MLSRVFRGRSLRGAPLGLTRDEIGERPLFVVGRAFFPLQAAQFALDEGVDVAVHDGLRRCWSPRRCEVLDHLVGLEDVAANLAAPGDVAFLAVWRRRSRRVFLSCSICWSFALSMFIAVTLFFCWLRSAWQATTRPRGNVTRRTAVSTLFTFWPPLPPLRKVSTSMSASLISMGASSGNLRHDVHAGKGGVPALVGIERRDAHEPVHAALGLQIAVGVFALDLERDGLDARFFAELDVDDWLLKPCRSIQRWYMRRSMSAQSHDSVPPAPELMVRKALERSIRRRAACSVRNRRAPLTMAAYSLLAPPATAGLRSFGFAEGEFHEHGRSSICRSSASSGLTLPRRAETSSTFFWARSLLVQKSGSAIRPSSSARRACSFGRSKIPPQFADAGFQVVGDRRIGDRRTWGKYEV